MQKIGKLSFIFNPKNDPFNILKKVKKLLAFTYIFCIILLKVGKSGNDLFWNLSAYIRFEK